MAIATDKLTVLLRSISLEQRERFAGRAVRYHGPYIMRANGRVEDLLEEERPETLSPEYPVVVFRMPDDPKEEISAGSVTIL